MSRYGGGLMLKLEYSSFQYMVVYIAVLQGGLGAGQWLSYGPSKFRKRSMRATNTDTEQILRRPLLLPTEYWR